MTKTYKFGGNWTEEKLNRVEKYLKAYAAIMNKQNFGLHILMPLLVIITHAHMRGQT